MNYNIEMLYDIFKKVENIIESYERTQYYNKNCDLHFADGTFLNYSVPKKSVAHLLGINTNHLYSTGLFKNNSSYELLKELLSKGADWVYKNIEERIIDPKKLFSDYIEGKLEAFNDNIRIDFKEIEFVVKCDRQRIINKGYDVENYDYIIVRKKHDKYMLLGISINDKHYVNPISNQLYDYIEQLIKKNKFRFDEQELTFILYGVYKDGYNKIGEYGLDAKTKLIQFNKLKKYASKFNSAIDISKDYEYCLSKYNNSIVIKNESKNTSTEQMIFKYKKLQEELLNLNKVIEKQKNQIHQKDEIIENLKKDNKEMEEFVAKIRKLVKKKKLLLE